MFPAIFGLSPGMYSASLERVTVHAARIDEEQLFIPATVAFSSTVHVIYQLKPRQP